MWPTVRRSMHVEDPGPNLTLTSTFSIYAAVLSTRHVVCDMLNPSKHPYRLAFMADGKARPWAPTSLHDAVREVNVGVIDLTTQTLGHEAKRRATAAKEEALTYHAPTIVYPNLLFYDLSMTS